MDFKDAIRGAADNVKRSARCQEHGEYPNYELTKTSKGVDTKWTFCCDKQKELVTKAFEKEMTKEVGNSVDKALKDIFKR